MSNLTDELAAAKAAASKMQKQADALRRSIVTGVEKAGLELKLTRLRTDIEIAERDIQTRTVLAQARGAEPEVDDLVRRLKELEGELDELKAKYGLESDDPPRKRWYEFWK